jgi:hypothetical protein
VKNFTAFFVLLSAMSVMAKPGVHKNTQAEPIFGSPQCKKSVSGHSRQEVIFDRLNQGRISSAKTHQSKLEMELLTQEFESIELITESTANEVYKVRLKNGQLAIWKPEPKYWTYRDAKTATDFNLYREVIVYEIAKRMGIFNVPVTVEREWQGARGSLQAFVNRDSSKYTKNSLNELKVLDWFVGQYDRAPLCEGNCLPYKGFAVGYDNGFLLQVDSNFKQQRLSEIDLMPLKPKLARVLSSELSLDQLIILITNRLNQAEINYLINSHQMLIQKLH